MDADALAAQGAKTSAAMVLILIIISHGIDINNQIDLKEANMFSFIISIVADDDC